MSIRIALYRSREDIAWPTAGSVFRDFIASAQWALGSSAVRSSRFWWTDPSTGLADFESHRERVARRGKEMIRVAQDYLTKEMAEAKAADAAARAAAEEEAIRACILKKRERRNTRAHSLVSRVWHSVK
ncbi:E3 ubiquitin-protein ligase XB3 [Hordeum vulgare]|nr:E3 ubiquitin-protein ligase XB3 [Hordeum vulgare]